MTRQPMPWSCIPCSTQAETPGPCWGGCKGQLTPTPQRAVRHDHDREEDAA
ncbi:hypothetical protein ACVWYO_002590 [Sphingomonas sp. UYP23]